MKNHYFQFSKKERTALLFGVILNFVLAVWPHFSTRGLPLETEHWLATLPMDSINNAFSSKPIIQKATNRTIFVSKHPERFYFDPNATLQADWQRLGVSDKTSAGILKYLAKGGRFRKPEDLRKIYSLQQALADSLIPWVKISVASPVNASFPQITNRKDGSYNSKNSRQSVIDINKADSTDWVALPGIGPGFARRILNFREKLGGFVRIDQVGETYGLADSVFQKIRSMLVLGNYAVRKLSLNNASKETLQQHPYIRWKGAQSIITYRDAHGSIKSTRELLSIPYFTEELFGKLEPYLSLE